MRGFKFLQFREILITLLGIIALGIIYNDSLLALIPTDVPSFFNYTATFSDFGLQVNDHKSSPEIENQQKIVLLWTPITNISIWRGWNGKIVPGQISKNNTCLVTTNRSLIHKASALFFHDKWLNYSDLPDYRNSKQRWCYYNHESPKQSQNVDNCNHLGFNWTVTYRRNADVFAPYNLFDKRSQLNYLEVDNRSLSFAESFSHREKDAVWFVTHCKTSSKREVWVEDMRKSGVDVDIFGGCGKKTPEEVIRKMGRHQFFSKYRYYLSIENSLCEDYVTEKLGFGLKLSLQYGLIPIVYGLEDYSNTAPNSSYIAAEAFSSVKDLAHFLKSLEKKPVDEIKKYFSWHNELKGVCNWAFVRLGFERACQKLFVEEETGCKASNIGEPIVPCQNPFTTITNMSKAHGQCRPSKLLQS